MLALATPVVLAEIGWVSMGLVDTIIVGPLGPAAIGAVGIGSILFQALAIFGMGLLLGLETLVSHAYGAGHGDECRRWLVQGVWLGLFVAPPLTVVAVVGLWLLPSWGFTPEVLRLLRPYLGVITWSLLPLLLYAAFRRYLQAITVVRPVTVALVSANAINALAAWALVYGHLGAPALGTTGSALATLCSRVYMAGFLLAIAVREARRAHRPTNDARPEATDDRRLAWNDRLPNRRRLVRLLRLGLPAASQVTLELGVFAVASALAGRLDPVSLASHQVTLNLASLTFMVPLGLASAAAVRVGHAVGRHDARGVFASGTTALLLGAGFMTLAGIAFVAIPGPLVRVFTTDGAILALTRRVLLVTAAVQLFDGLQGVCTGIFRGLGDTRTPMVVAFVAHWLLGLPLAYTLCFRRGLGVVGLWIGLSAGLFVVALVLVTVWRRRVAALPL
jgi:multidrug resistance protein, MATE family